MPKILLVDDDQTLSIEIVEFLRAKMFTAEAALTVAKARDFIMVSYYDLLILDINLPDGNGVDLLREIRGRGITTPVLMLTTLADIQSKETGFQAGTDDYLTKPFHPRELLLRIESLLRRPARTIDTQLRAGELCLDQSSRIVTLGGESITLLPREFALLEFFLRHPNQVFSAETLLERVWETDSETGIDTVVTTISRLRKKMGQEKAAIKNVFGVGYKLETS